MTPLPRGIEFWLDAPLLALACQRCAGIELGFASMLALILIFEAGDFALPELTLPQYR